jgi:exoribonuclease R
MKISGVLDILSKTKYGMTSRGVPMYLFTPLNPDMPQMICACSLKEEVTKNILVVAEKMTDDKLPRGKIVHFLGECGDIHAEESAIHYAYAPEYWCAFPDIVEPNIPNKFILDVDTVNIDPEGCIDIDDCISFWEHHVAITIADVAEWIKVNPWMTCASKIGQTLYMNGTPVRKLFPHEYQMSLIPSEKRYGISLIFDFIGNTISNMRFENVIVINKKSYTYENCGQWKYAKRLQKLAEHIAEKRLDDPHEWIAELMKFYNRQVASCVAAAGFGLLRGHDAPSMEKVEAYRKIGLPEHLAFSSAQYYPATDNVEHCGLGGVYCHATSPIRRYADCVNQMALKGMDIEDCHAQLNKLQKYAKKHSRDLTFLHVIHKNTKVSGIVVNSRRIWCAELECMITCENDGFPGKKMDICYFYDPNKPTWKKRLVFRALDTNHTSSPLQEQ